METMETLQPESQSLPVVKEPPGSQQPGRVRCQRCGIAVPWQVPLIRHCGRPTCQVKSSGTTNTKGSAIWQCNILQWCDVFLTAWRMLTKCSRCLLRCDIEWNSGGCGEWGDKVHAEPWTCTAGLDLQDSNFSYGFHLGKSTPRLLDSTSAAAQEAGVTYVWHQKTYQTFHKLRHLRIRDAHKNRLRSTTLLHHVTSCYIMFHLRHANSLTLTRSLRLAQLGCHFFQGVQMPKQWSPVAGLSNWTRHAWSQLQPLQVAPGTSSTGASFGPCWNDLLWFSNIFQFIF